MTDPIPLFQAIWRDAKANGTLTHRNAVCVSTIDADGFPNSRFVDLKQADSSGFVFCTHLDSAKALDIQRNPKVGMTMWWEHVATQIRIKGVCTTLSEQEADQHWKERSREAQIVTATFQQSRPLSDMNRQDTNHLEATYQQATERFAGRAVPRPRNWGGFRLQANNIEFLTFRANRLHRRTAYTLINEMWRVQLLQP